MDFLEKRLELHPILSAVVRRVDGLGSTLSQEQHKTYAVRRTLVATRPHDESSPEIYQTQWFMPANHSLERILQERVFSS